MPLSSRFASLTFAVALFAGCQTSQDLGRARDDEDSDSNPTGLRAFMSSRFFDGNLVAAAGLPQAHEAADSLCASSARAAGLEGQWVAFLSSGTQTAVARLVDDGPFYAVDGTTLLYSDKYAVGGGAQAPLLDEKGNTPPRPDTFWTGSTSDVASAGADCGQWTLNSEGSRGTRASVEGRAPFDLSCNQFHHLLCLEQSRPLAAPTRDKLVFVTGASFSPTFATATRTGIEAADDECTKAATAAGLPGTFHAWLSSETEDGTTTRAVERLSPARYIRLDGQVVFEDLAQVDSSGPRNPININEEGTFTGDRPVWTGTRDDGQVATNAHCDGWSVVDDVDLGTKDFARVGNSGRSNNEWTDWTTVVCSKERAHLYCFEE